MKTLKAVIIYFIYSSISVLVVYGCSSCGNLLEDEYADFSTGLANSALIFFIVFLIFVGVVIPIIEIRKHIK